MKIFGVINASADSPAAFSIATDYEAARNRAADLVAAGASFIDIGAEGSTELAIQVSPEQEWALLCGPLKGALSVGVDVAVDTRHAEVAKLALDEGAKIINAGEALQSQAMLELAADSDASIVLPFMLGTDFRNMRIVKGNPVDVMLDWFEAELRRLKPWGVTDRLLLDPGVGYTPIGVGDEEHLEYRKAVYYGLPKLRRFGLPLYIPMTYVQSPARMELMDLILSYKPEYVRAHTPSQILARKAAVDAGNPLPHDQLSNAHV